MGADEIRQHEIFNKLNDLEDDQIIDRLFGEVPEHEYKELFHNIIKNNESREVICNFIAWDRFYNE